MPKVSVIVPNYNHARFLEQRIQSILDQTYQDFELIYLDDASTDNSNEVFAKFSAHPKVRSICNTTNSGSPFKQWNKGVNLAQGEYIWIAESDDYAEPNFLETLVTVLDQNPKVGIAYCRSWIVDQHANILCSCRDWITNPAQERWKKDFINSGTDECSKSMVYENIILNASSAIIRREVYEKAGFADETMRLCGDWLMWVKILLLSDVAYINKPLNYYRYHLATVRRQSDLNGLSVEEYYKTINFILNNINCSSKLAEEVLQKAFIKWKRDLFAKDSKIPSDRLYRIYKLANGIDSKLHYRILREFPIPLLKQSPLATSARPFVRHIKSVLGS